MKSTSDQSVILPPPVITEEMVAKCEELNDYRHILFEYYRFVAQLCVICSCLLYESPAWNKRRTRKTWEVCAGSLSRIKNLMSANLEYFQDDRYIEATQIMDRCIFETAAKVCWISQDPSEERLLRFLEGSLRPDREHQVLIERNIEERGVRLKIEERMLSRMDRFEKLAGLREVATKDLRRMPDLSSILSDIGHGRGIYVAVGKVGSHAVHGNWQQLLTRNLIEEDNVLSLKFRPGTSDPSQYALISFFVMEACLTFVRNCFEDDAEESFSVALEELVSTTTAEIQKWLRVAIGCDFEELR